MDITYEQRSNRGHRLVATEGRRVIGHVGWYVEDDGTWMFNSLSVAGSHRRKGVATALMEAAKARRIAEGDAPWRNTPATAAGTAAVDRYVANNYDTDPRQEMNNG